MELTQSPVFYLLLLSAAMGICVYLFISLKRAIFRLDRRGRTTEQFLSCILSDQLYWSKETPTNGQDGTTASWRWVKSVWPPAIAQALEEMLGAKVEFDWLPIEAVLPTACSEDTWWQTEFSGLGGALVQLNNARDTLSRELSEASRALALVRGTAGAEHAAQKEVPRERVRA